MNKLRREHVQNALDTFKRTCPELEGFILQPCDGRLGKKIALARMIEGGAIDLQSNFMTFSEMNQFLRGYFWKADKRWEKFNTKQQEGQQW